MTEEKKPKGEKNEEKGNKPQMWEENAKVDTTDTLGGR